MLLNSKNIEYEVIFLSLDIHTGKKKIIAGRLAVAGANVAYNLHKYPTNGPFPVSFGPAKEKEGWISIQYDRSKVCFLI